MTRDWFLVNNTPVYVWALTAVYLSIVLFGPTYMRHRKPCNVPLWFIATYNLGCVLLSMYMTVEVKRAALKVCMYRRVEWICIAVCSQGNVSTVLSSPETHP